MEKEQLRGRLLAWEDVLRRHTLPAWEDFPLLPLYMDQVIYLMNGYLALLPDQDPEDRTVTPAMINNYVKLKMIPAPEKKRYHRVHLAYLVMVCILKQTLNAAELRRLLPADLPEESVKALYAAFLSSLRDSREEFCSAVRAAARPVMEEEKIAHLVFRTAASAALFKLASRQIIALGEEQGN